MATPITTAASSNNNNNNHHLAGSSSLAAARERRGRCAHLPRIIVRVRIQCTLNHDQRKRTTRNSKPLSAGTRPAKEKEEEEEETISVSARPGEPACAVKKRVLTQLTKRHWRMQNSNNKTQNESHKDNSHERLFALDTTQFLLRRAASKEIVAENVAVLPLDWITPQLVKSTPRIELILIKCAPLTSTLHRFNASTPYIAADNGDCATVPTERKLHEMQTNRGTGADSRHPDDQQRQHAGGNEQQVRKGVLGDTLAAALEKAPKQGIHEHQQYARIPPEKFLTVPTQEQQQQQRQKRSSWSAGSIARQVLGHDDDDSTSNTIANSDSGAKGGFFVPVSSFGDHKHGYDTNTVCAGCEAAIDRPPRGTSTVAASSLVANHIHTNGYDYHAQCFVCTQCGDSLVGRPFYFLDDIDVMCHRDYHRLRPVQCCAREQCIYRDKGNGIAEHSRISTLRNEDGVHVVHLRCLELSFHVECLRCLRCPADGPTLNPSESYFDSMSDAVFCSDHFQPVLCVGCGYVIAGAVLFAFGARWHASCCVCVTCGSPITTGDVMLPMLGGDGEKKTQPLMYCHIHGTDRSDANGLEKYGADGLASLVGPELDAAADIAEAERTASVSKALSQLRQPSLMMKIKRAGGGDARVKSTGGGQRTFVIGDDALAEGKPTLSSKKAKKVHTYLVIGGLISHACRRALKCRAVDRKSGDRDNDIDEDFGKVNVQRLIFGKALKYELRDFAPNTFSRMRARFGISDLSYFTSLVIGGFDRSGLATGASKATFFVTKDSRYVVKSIPTSDAKSLRSILPRYVQHMDSQPHTLLSRFFGLFQIKVWGKWKRYFVIMNNVVRTLMPIHATFDLKGSTKGRDVKVGGKGTGVMDGKGLHLTPAGTGNGGAAGMNAGAAIPVFRDVNFKNKVGRLRLGESQKRALLKQLRSDCDFLADENLMDYSLLVGVHNGTTETFMPASPGERHVPVAMISEGALCNPLGRCNAGGGALQGAGNEERASIFQSCRGGLRSFDDAGLPLPTVYFVGVVDILQHFNLKKRLERAYKNIRYRKEVNSSVAARHYADRLVEFVNSHAE